MGMRMFGHPASFAIEYELVSDPDGLRPDWGALRLWVEHRNLTRGRLDDGTIPEHAVLPLEPIARWLLTHWDALFNENRLPWPRVNALTAAQWVDKASVVHDFGRGDALFAGLEEIQGYRSRHSLGAALPGYRVPELYFRRFESRIELSWSDASWRGVDSGIRLLEPGGVACLRPSVVTEPLLAWLQSLAADFAEVSPLVVASAEIREGLERLHAADRGRVRLGWAIGDRLLAKLDSLALEELFSSVLPAEHSLSLPTPALLLKSASPELSAADARSLWEQATQAEPAGAACLLEALASPELAWGSGPDITVDGYDKALALRDQLGLPEDAPLCGALDLESRLLPQMGISVKDITLEDPRIEGAAIWQPGRKPTILINRNGRFSATPTERRMTLAHELCHLLHDIDASGRVGIVSNPWAEYALERRANAFAAMLLMPGPAVDVLLAPERAEPADLRRVMAILGVSAAAFMRHVENLGFINGSTRALWTAALTADPAANRPRLQTAPPLEATAD